MKSSASPDTTALIAQTRFGWGAIPNGRFEYDANPSQVLKEQLGDFRVPSAPSDAGETSEMLYRYFAVKQFVGSSEYEAELTLARRALWQAAFAERKAFFTRALTTTTPFADRLLAFWTDHFAVSARNSFVSVIAGPYMREAIAPHVTGRFCDMLNAVVRHPAMLRYLDNSTSIGPHSPAGRRAGRGLNENLGREVLELHTLGVDGGYSQADVTAFAATLTGWTFGGPKSDAPGTFLFRENWHEPGPQTVLGTVYDQPGEKQAEAVLAAIARHPATARHIAFELARHFVGDVPPPALVAALSERFEKTDGDLKAVSAALVDHPEAWTSPRTRYLPPQDFIVALSRAFPGTLEPKAMPMLARQMGQPVWQPPSPEGYQDASAEWLGPESLKLRLKTVSYLAQKDPPQRFAETMQALYGDALSPETRRTVMRAESPAQAMALLVMSPDFLRR